VLLKNQATFLLNEDEPLGDNVEINFEDALSWVKLIEVKPDTVISSYLDHFMSGGVPASLDTNLRVNWTSY
jgi:hypothetical protein